jgi:hypothetical protein
MADVQVLTVYLAIKSRTTCHSLPAEQTFPTLRLLQLQFLV